MKSPFSPFSHGLRPVAQRLQQPLVHGLRHLRGGLRPGFTRWTMGKHWENGLISGVFILNNGIIVDLLEVYWDWNEWTGWFHRVFMGISRGFHGCCWISRGLMEANKNWEVAVWGYLLHTYGYPWKMTHLHDQVTLLEKYTWPLPTIYHN